MQRPAICLAGYLEMYRMVDLDEFLNQCVLFIILRIFFTTTFIASFELSKKIFCVIFSVLG